MPRKDEDPIGVEALAKAFDAYVVAAFMRNPLRTMGPQDGFDPEALEQAEDEAAERLQEILKARKVRRDGGA